MDSKKRDKEFRNRLIVSHLFDQIQAHETIESKNNNAYIDIYFQTLKDDDMKHKIYNFSNNIAVITSMPHNRINDLFFNLSLVFNMIQYLMAFRMHTISLSDCFELLISTINSEENEKKYLLEYTKEKKYLLEYTNEKKCEYTKEKKYLLNHYFSCLYLMNSAADPEVSFELIKVAYTQRPNELPFFVFLFYQNLNLYLAKGYSADKEASLIEMVFEDDLKLFIRYSFVELKLLCTKKYIKLFQMKVDAKKGYQEKLNYYCNAFYLLNIYQNDVKFDQNTSGLVNAMCPYLLNRGSETKGIVNLIENIESKDYDAMVLRGLQIERGNQCILKKIQTQYWSPMRLLELFTHFYNNCLVVDKELFPFECQLIENLVMYIITRWQSAEWKRLFKVPFFQLILFHLIQWYTNSNYFYTKTTARNYLMILIMHKLYDKINCFLRSVALQGEYDCDFKLYQNLFKDHQLYLKTKKADTYYQLGKYTKATELYCYIHKQNSANWKIVLKVAICYLKAHEIKQAKVYFDKGMRLMDKEAVQYKAELERIKLYLNLFKEGSFILK